MCVDEAARLEALWRGGFGTDYTARNAAAGDPRGPFWRSCLDRYRAKSVLEVGCNLGANLRWIAPAAPGPVAGIDVNETALATLRRDVPRAHPVVAAARALPFREGAFDLVFTIGVLIHQPPDRLRDVMAEIVRCAGRWVLCGEYYGMAPTEVPYRGQSGALFKRDFGTDYQRWFASLRLVDCGFLSRDEGWGDVTYWTFEKR